MRRSNKLYPLLTTLLLLSCGGGGGSSSQEESQNMSISPAASPTVNTFPGASWEIVDPSVVGMDKSKLQQALKNGGGARSLSHKIEEQLRKLAETEEAALVDAVRERLEHSKMSFKRAVAAAKKASK